MPFETLLLYLAKAKLYLMKKNIALLGATGSIGTQVLEIVAENPTRFNIGVLTAQNNAALLIEQALMFRPDRVVIGNIEKYQLVKEALQTKNIQVLAGQEALCTVVASENIDIVLTALVGYSGLKPTIKAIEAKKDIALANKETLVVAGILIAALVKKHGVSVLPIDSEHSAIFQCMKGEQQSAVEKIILTASGGPFRGKTATQLAHVTKAQALKNPNWQMGAKITIDSATLMNKGLEVIEAKWLFGLEQEQIEVIVHPQSIIHSMVQFKDGSIKAQMGLPDMKLPILYALNYPERTKTNFERFSFIKYPTLTFEAPDAETFINLQLAFEALKKGGNMPCVLNAANEIAVSRFLNDEIDFLDIARINEACIETIDLVENPDYEDFVQTDFEARKVALSF